MVSGAGALIVIIASIAITGTLIYKLVQAIKKSKQSGLKLSVMHIISYLFSIIVWNFPLMALFLMFINGNAILADGITQYFRPIDLNVYKAVMGETVPFLILAVIVSVSFYFTNKLTKGNGILLLGSIALLELWVINASFIDTVRLITYVNPNQSSMKQIQRDMEANGNEVDDYRVLTFSNNKALKPNAMPIFGMRHAMGFHDNELATYSEFRGGSRSGNFTQAFPKNPFLDIANVGYLLIDQGEAPQIMKNETAFPRFKIFGAATQVEDATSSLKYGIYDHSTTLLYSEGDIPQINNTALQGIVKSVDSPRTDEFTVDVESSEPAVLFFSENYHKYWQATVNGEMTPIVKAFGTFQAVVIPAGQSTVTFEYISGAVEFAKKIMGISLILSLFLAVWCIVADRKSARENIVA